MKRYFYSFKQEDVGYFFKPTSNDFPPEDAKINCRRDVVAHAPDYVKNGAQNCSFVYCGYFDDDSGVFVSPDEPLVLITQLEMFDLIRKGVADVPGTSGSARQ